MRIRGRGHVLVLAAMIGLLSACDRPKAQADVAREVAESRSEAAQEMADTRRDAVGDLASAREDAADKILDADRDAVEAQTELLNAANDAEYKIALEQASGDRDIAMKKCEVLSADLQKSCKDRASADYAEAQARADENRTERSPS